MKLAIAGCAGRMGQTLMRRALATPGVTLAGGSVRAPGRFAGGISAMLGVSAPDARLFTDADSLFAAADAVIDFTTPDYSLHLGEIAAKTGKILVCGTTGLQTTGIDRLKLSAKAGARIVYSSNMSVGVNLLLGLVEKVASVLDAAECDIEIDEMHHRHKVDAPSGTALMLGEAAARGRGVRLADVQAHYGPGTLGARRQGAIGFSVRRGGDVIGEHTVTFACAGERLELAHKSSSRDIYATGAIRAALWAQGRQAGFYTMKDVLGL